MELQLSASNILLACLGLGFFSFFFLYLLLPLLYACSSTYLKL